MKRWRTPFVMSAASLVAVTTFTIPTTAQAGPLPAGPENPDFETGNLTGWTVVSGTAFGNAAVTDRSTFWNGPFNHHGKFHLWGHLAAGDDAQGELSSSSFAAPGALSFLVAGGWDPQRLYVALVRDSDGKELLKQTGMDDEAYVRIHWDTSQWRGQAVHLKVVDRKSGDWGHINLDGVRTQNPLRADNGLTYRPLGQANQPAPDSVSAAERYAADPLRPQFHYTPYQGWINDPNGLIQWKGRHHLFSQFNPDAPKWGPMHWAHAEGRDAVHWRELPVALTPPPPASPGDNSGIFSGSAVDDNGTLTLTYTHSTDTRFHPGATPETVEMATSTDGVNFRPVDGNPVIAEAPPGSGAGFRDPKVFRDPTDGRWKMVVGSGQDGKGKVHLYASDNLRKWTYQGVLLEGDGTTGGMWECPDFFPLDGKWVLLYSTNEGGQSLQRYAVGSYDGRRFTADRHGILDGGSDIYAAQSYPDDKGKRLMVAWMADWNAMAPTRVNGWAGAQSIHRELFLRSDGGLGQRAVGSVGSLATGSPVTAGNRTVRSGSAWRMGTGSSARLRAELDLAATTADTVTVSVHASSAESTEIRYQKSTGTLTLDTRKAGYGSQGDKGVWTTKARPNADGTLAIDVLIDRSSVEVFTADGAALTGRVHPRYVESNGVEFSAEGGALHIKRARLTQLGSSWTD